MDLCKGKDKNNDAPLIFTHALALGRRKFSKRGNPTQWGTAILAAHAAIEHRLGIAALDRLLLPRTRVDTTGLKLAARSLRDSTMRNIRFTPVHGAHIQLVALLTARVRQVCERELSHARATDNAANVAFWTRADGRGNVARNIAVHYQRLAVGESDVVPKKKKVEHGWAKDDSDDEEGK
jgi:hypothetical protein